ncbi:hypothetical protein THAOC_32101, partial [Thalassiosira oceanica]
RRNNAGERQRQRGTDGPIPMIPLVCSNNHAWGFFFLSALLHTWNDHFHGQNCSDSKTITKESVFVDASWWAQIPGFRRCEPMPSDLSYAIGSRRFDVGRSLVSSAGTHHQVDSRRESRQSSAFRRPPEAAGGSYLWTSRRRRRNTAMPARGGSLNSSDSGDWCRCLRISDTSSHHGVIDVGRPLARLKTARVVEVDSRP